MWQVEFKDLREHISDHSVLPEDWGCDLVLREECMGYFAWNRKTKEALVIDPMKEAQEIWDDLLRKHSDLKILAVIDTHTHADHFSYAGELAEKARAPMIMHQLSPSSKPTRRVSSDEVLKAEAGNVQFLETPGHTPDGVTVLWGPFLFSGDTILYGDTGRDDLPGGDAVAHCASLRKIEKWVKPTTLLAPGHDNRGGRITCWQTQLEVNPSLTQCNEDFIREAAAFVGTPPKNLKESLLHNCK